MSPEALVSFAHAFQAIRTRENLGRRILQNAVDSLPAADFAVLKSVTDRNEHLGPYTHTSLSAPTTPEFRALQRFERYANGMVVLEMSRSGTSANELLRSTVCGMCEDEWAALAGCVTARFEREGARG